MVARKSNNLLPPPGCFSEQSTEESTAPQRNQGSGDGMGAGQKAAIRIGAELAQDYIEKEPGEQWRVLSFSYPYLAGGSDYIPFSPLKHRATDELVTSLECVSGPDKGLCVDVGYRRWEDPASFHSEYEESRDAARKDADTLATIEASGLVKGRLYTFNEPVLYIWPTGEDDPLRNPETFADVLRTLRDATGDPEFGLNLVLLEKDAPAILQRQFPTDDATLSERHVFHRPRPSRQSHSTGVRRTRLRSPTPMSCSNSRYSRATSANQAACGSTIRQDTSCASRRISSAGAARRREGGATQSLPPLRTSSSALKSAG